MGDRAFIAAHLAADLYRQSIYALGVRHISTSGAVGEKMSSWHQILLGLFFFSTIWHLQPTLILHDSLSIQHLYPQP
jgi:hypothetical protein